MTRVVWLKSFEMKLNVKMVKWQLNGANIYIYIYILTQVKEIRLLQEESYKYMPNLLH